MEFKNVRAIIFISPIASGIKLVSPEIDFNTIEKIDVFSNLKKISDIICPIFMIHGKKDEIVPIAQSVEMSKYIKLPYEWFPKHGDHINILTKYRTKFFQKCKFFIEYLNYYFSKKISVNTVSISFAGKHVEDKSFNYNLLVEGYAESPNGKPYTCRDKGNLLDNLTPKKKPIYANSIASNCPFDKEVDDMVLSCSGSKRDSFEEQRVSKESIGFKGQTLEEQYNKYFKTGDERKHPI
jgi:hypothetical protein